MKRLSYPFKKEDIKKLKVGDMVLISGKMFTGRDAVHHRIHTGTKPPVDLKNQIIYHCGPVIIEKGNKYEVKAAGPTTSIREEPYQWEVMRDYGILGVIGKGGMGPKTLKGCKDYGCVYFHAIGGAAQVLAEKIKSIDNVYWKDLGSPEAIWEMTVEDFPVVVTMDSHGNSLHEKVQASSKKVLDKLL
ncbi:MAG: FumA C-terminus/TtdB family hydratase beta subunit [Bacteriovoracaceae bacterium]|jgi:fumarate hydratase class I|nr:FumA C-terminus/TtdB family hydratase beta subunit [Bacteriovoracaceae bacterium]